MTRVLLDDWTREPVRERPYRWLHSSEGQLFSPAHAAQLAQGFPTTEFTRHDQSARQSGKSYRNFSLQLVSPEDMLGSGAAGRLPKLWRDLLADLLDEVYREQVAELLGQPPVEQLEIRLVRHTAGDWLDPHTDRADKRFSHIIYFNPVWRAEWGGCLEILKSQDPKAIAARVVPRLGTSALLARTDNSWHRVSRVTATAQTPPDRMSLLVHGLRPDNGQGSVPQPALESGPRTPRGLR